jgi:hypothetical protein
MLEIFGISLACIVVGVQMTEVFKFVQALALVALSITGEPARDTIPLL